MTTLSDNWASAHRTYKIASSRDKCGSQSHDKELYNKSFQPRHSDTFGLARQPPGEHSSNEDRHKQSQVLQLSEIRPHYKSDCFSAAQPSQA